MRRCLIDKFVFCGLLLPLWCAAVQSYRPVIADPVLEPWRWRHEEILDGLGVCCVDEAEDGTLWFGNVGGLAHYDGLNVMQIPFDEELLSKIIDQAVNPRVKALVVLRSGNPLMLIGKSLVLWESGGWRVLIRDVGPSVFTAQLIEAATGEVWLVVPGALWRISEDLEESVVVMKASAGGALMSICLDDAGDVWVVENDKNRSSQLIHIPVQNGRPENRSKWHEVPVPFDNDTFEARIVAGRDGLIWYTDSSLQSGLEAFDPRRGEWVTREHATPPRRYYSLLKGRDGTVWAGSEGRLLYSPCTEKDICYSPEQLQLPRVPLSLYEAGNGRLWVIGRIGYVYSVDIGTSEWQTYTGLHFQCETADGVQWFLFRGRNHVVSYDPVSDVWRRYGPEDELIDMINRISVSSHGLIWATGSHKDRAAFSVFNGTRWVRICHSEFAQWINPNAVFEAEDGAMWFGAGGMLLTDVRHAGGALEYKVNKDKSIQLVKHHAPPEFPYYVSSLSMTPDKTLWVGSTVVHQYDKLTMKARAVPGFEGENTVDMALDHNQKLWIARGHFGIYQQQGDMWRAFTEEDGLASRMLCDLLVLHDGSILASSAKGISRFDGKSWTKHAYPDWFGMARALSGMRESVDGSIWLNYSPEELRPAQIMINLTDRFCTVRHRAETDPPNTCIMDYLKRVAQPGNTHIMWSACEPWNRTPLDQLQYSWRLNGGEWSAFSHQTSKTFLDLNRGRHVLEVCARDHAFNVDPTPDRITFEVIAPVWRQAWFLIMISFFTGLVLLLTWSLIRTRERHLIERQEEREQHLVEMDRLKTGFFTNISHELRTPITVILGWVEIMRAMEDDQNKKGMLSVLTYNAQRVATLITQLLDFRKIQEGRLAVEATQGDLVPVMRKWVASLKPLAESEQISCSLESVEACWGWFDFDKLQKIFTNLITNSIKYTPSGGKICVNLQVECDGRQKPQLRFMVEDTGVGIAEEHLSHIFDRFYRVSEDSVVAGAGIGLNLTKELVDLLGGEIRAESPIHSDAEHPGTRFTVFLPMDGEMGEDGTRRREDAKETAIEPEALRAFAPSREAHPSLMGEDTPLILIVEDDEDIRNFIEEGLASVYRMETAENGAVGLQKAKEQVPDLVVTDLMMPVMDGIEMCRELKTSLETSHIPVVMLTAKTTHESQIEGLKTGADDYITKPFHMDLLQVRIANLLESRRVLREKFCREYPVITSKIPENTPDKEFLERALCVLEKNYPDYEFSSDTFASLLHMSLSTLRRKLKAVADRTPGDFINEFRMMRASELLTNTSCSITDIAFQVGCDETSNFSRKFKKYYGVSPLKYRSAHRS